jgi:hypothetical protein
MTPRSRSYVFLAATLVVGMVLGALLVGAAGQWRARRIEGMRDGSQFARDLERMIRPRDEAQAAALRPILEATAARNGEIIRGFDEQMRGALADLVDELEPLLDEDQRARLRRFAARPPPASGPAGGRPPPGGRRPPPERR